MSQQVRCIYTYSPTEFVIEFANWEEFLEPLRDLKTYKPQEIGGKKQLYIYIYTFLSRYRYSIFKRNNNNNNNNNNPKSY